MNTNVVSAFTQALVQFATVLFATVLFATIWFAMMLFATIQLRHLRYAAKQL
ncbi:hypothetical protein [Shewanella baltica]|uniref:hypothetical protein n=1 Tax=Shewanella baltica TaxID=62322 RepID=UPI0003250F34|nr:hypothetical protein [Shewanella baltica]